MLGAHSQTWGAAIWTRTRGVCGGEGPGWKAAWRGSQILITWHRLFLSVV